VYVDRPIENVIGLHPVKGVEQLITRQDAAVRLKQRDEKAKFNRCECHGPPREQDLMALEVDRNITALEHGTGGLIGPGKDALDAEDELGRGERLGKVIVRADAQSGDSIGRGAPRGENDNRDERLSADRPEDRQAIDLGKHDVEYDERGMVALDRLEGAPAVGRLDDPVALAFEVGPYEAHDLDVIVDDQDWWANLRPTPVALICHDGEW
jgi:hypothetical protein